MVTLRVPEDLKDKFGVSRLKKSLKTTDLAIAERRKVPLLAHWRLLFELALDKIKQQKAQLQSHMRLFGRPGLYDDYVAYCAQARKARMEALKQREKERQELIEVLTWIFIVVVVWGGLGYGAYYWFTK